MTSPGTGGSDARAQARASADAAATDGFELPGAPDAFERFWNAHRMAYVSKGTGQVKDEHTCPFCAAPQRDDEHSLIVHRGRTAYVVLNLYPYNPGHLLVCPYRHVPLYTDTTTEEAAEMAELTQTAMLALGQAAGASGYNLGMNQGAVAGAGIAAHLHQHVVPRWTGDGNFLPIIARTKNMSQTLGRPGRSSRTSGTGPPGTTPRARRPTPVPRPSILARGPETPPDAGPSRARRHHPPVHPGGPYAPAGRGQSGHRDGRRHTRREPGRARALPPGAPVLGHALHHRVRVLGPGGRDHGARGRVHRPLGRVPRLHPGPRAGRGRVPRAVPVGLRRRRRTRGRRALRGLPGPGHARLLRARQGGGPRLGRARGHRRARRTARGHPRGRRPHRPRSAPGRPGRHLGAARRSLLVTVGQRMVAVRRQARDDV